VPIEVGRETKRRRIETNDNNVDSKDITIFVVWHTSVCIQVHMGDSITDLRQKIETKTGIKPKNQFLSLGGKPLRDVDISLAHLQIDDYGIQQGSTLWLNKRPEVQKVSSPIEKGLITETPITGVWIQRNAFTQKDLNAIGKMADDGGLDTFVSASRSVGGESEDYKGHRCNYLNNKVPTQLMKSIKQVAKRADTANKWNRFPSLDSMNYRCIEVLDYGVGGGTGWHYDNKDKTQLTVLVMINPPPCGRGGTLQFGDWSSGIGYSVTKECPNLRRGDVVVFCSEVYHRVTALLEGKRRIVCAEIWSKTEAMGRGRR